MSSYSEQTVDEVVAALPNLSDDELVLLDSDERVGVREAVAKERERRDTANREEAETAAENYVRYEDREETVPQEEGFEPAPLSAEEVDPEESRKDDTSVLASDRYNEQGERI